MCQDIYSVLILDALVPLRQIYGLPDPLSGASIVDVALIPKFYRLEDPRCPYDGLLGGKKGRKRELFYGQSHPIWTLFRVPPSTMKNDG